jgi:hypothetical protein
VLCQFTNSCISISVFSLNNLLNESKAVCPKEVKLPSGFLANSTIYLLTKHFLTLFSIFSDKSNSIFRIGFKSPSKNQFFSVLNSLTTSKSDIGLGSLFKSTVIIF